MSSNNRNSVFSGVVPVMGEAQTVIPLAAGYKVLSQIISEALSETNPTARHSTGSVLLDSFIGDAANEAFALQTELSSLSFELKRIQNPRFRRATVSSDQKAVRSGARPAAEKKSHDRLENASDRSQKIAEAQHIQAKQSKDNASKAQASRHQAAIARPPMKPASPSIRSRITAKSTSKLGDRVVGRALNKFTSSAVATPVTAVSPATKAQDAPGTGTASAQSVPPQSVPPQSVPPQSVPPQSELRAKIVGGTDYKALQAKAETSGLINLDDSLLFGGTEQEASKPGVRSESLDSSFLPYLSEKIEDFTASPIRGGLHPTAHLSDSDSAQRFYKDTWCQTVLSLDTFKLSNLEAEASSDAQEAQETNAQPNPETAHTSEHPVELNDLGKQVTYLNQKIEYLSRRILELAEPSSDGVKAQRSEQKMNSLRERSSHENHGSVVMGLEHFVVSESRAQRIATLDTLSAAL